MTEHRLTGDVRNFVRGGKALFTVRSERTGTRFTYKVVKAKDREDLFFVKVLSGPDNTSSYTYIGAIFGDQFRSTAKSRVSPDAPSFKAFAWLNANLGNLPKMVSLFHHNHCGRCGRVLTDPTSIETGIGPICASKTN